MPMTWTDQADAKLLIGILHLSTQKIDYEALAEWMGPECTKIAVQRRIQRLREQVNKGFNTAHSASTSGSVADDDAGGGSFTSAPVSPKRKRGGQAGKGNGKAARNVKKVKNKQRDENEEEVGEVDAEMGDEED